MRIYLFPCVILAIHDFVILGSLDPFCPYANLPIPFRHENEMFDLDAHQADRARIRTNYGSPRPGIFVLAFMGIVRNLIVLLI